MIWSFTGFAVHGSGGQSPTLQQAAVSLTGVAAPEGGPVVSGTQSLFQAVVAGSLHWPCSAQFPFLLMGL